jgi:S-DNA-T family DNA segregation ATPase FtsK/SpoIIIE
MQQCRYPSHHESGRSDTSGLVLIVALVVAGFVVVRLAVAAVRFLEAWWWTFTLTLAVAAACTTYRRFRRSDQAKQAFWRPPSWIRYLPLAVWVNLTWRPVCRRLGLISRDRQTRPGSGRRPRGAHHPLAVAYPSRYGVVVRARTVAGVGREAVEREAEHFANHWRCVRLAVTEPAPGRLEVRGLRSDPLTEPLTSSVLSQFDGRHVVLGRDERGRIRSADLANLSGSAFSGSPGRGKTECALSLACQLAASPLVDTWVFDGGSCDWQPFADGVAGYVGDDLAGAADMLTLLDTLMGDRRRNLQRDRGVRNGWSLGPAEDYRLQWILVEEAPFYLDLDAVRGDRKREDLVRSCRGLLAGLLRRGRAPLFHVSMIAQKGTGTGGLPPDLRDLCGLRWSFGVATTEAAAAILGDDIRQHPTKSPVQLQGAEHAGVASVLFGGKDPYTLVRFPAIGQARADQLAARLAGAYPGGGDQRCAIPTTTTVTSATATTSATSSPTDLAATTRATCPAAPVISRSGDAAEPLT